MGLMAFGEEAVALPRWKGFNLVEGGYYHGPNAFVGYQLEDFEMIADFGFNFVRLPLDYRIFTTSPDWEHRNDFNEEKLRLLDTAIREARKHKIHVNLCFHRIPGYTVADDKEKLHDLFSNEEALKAAVGCWRMMAERYRAIPREELSFNLFNEPSGGDEASYLTVIEPMIKAIHEVSPDRLIFVDGLSTANDPIKALAKRKNIIQSFHCYRPFNISHYLATWVNPMPTMVPKWPCDPDGMEGMMGGIGKPEINSPLELRELPPCVVGVSFDDVSGNVTLRVEADGRTLEEFTLVPNDGSSEWSDVTFFPQWNIYQGKYNGRKMFKLEKGARKFTITVVKGDWIALKELRFMSFDREHTAKIQIRKKWGQSGFVQRFVGWGDKPFETCEKIKWHYPDAGREYLYRNVFKVWDAAMKAGTVCHVGEIGVWKKTPHAILLGVMEDYFKMLQERNVGFALWHLRGSMGVMDTERDDVDYVDYRGHKLDKQLLDLMKKY